ncbi:MAG TPA: hypothetical protein VK165_01510 [Azonexus sp.]|nr:hypothetical protein [Azonexus sp.]
MPGDDGAPGEPSGLGIARCRAGLFHFDGAPLLAGMLGLDDFQDAVMERGADRPGIDAGRYGYAPATAIALRVSVAMLLLLGYVAGIKPVA